MINSRAGTVITGTGLLLLGLYLFQQASMTAKVAGTLIFAGSVLYFGRQMI